MAQTYSIKTYRSDAAGEYPIRISNAVAALPANDRTVAFTDGNVSVSVSKHGQKRRTGITARGYILGLPTAAGATTYSQKTFVPILLKTTYDDANKGDLITYKAGQWRILDKVAET